MLYIIKFEVDTGVCYRTDTAVVQAREPFEAHSKLKRYINSLDSETCISRVYSIEPFDGEIFTGQHGMA